MTGTIAAPQSDAPALVRPESAGCTVVLNRPDKRNALGLVIRRAITRAVTQLAGDDVIGAIVIVGGDTVCATDSDLNLLDKNAQQVASIDLGRSPRPGAEIGAIDSAQMQLRALDSQGLLGRPLRVLKRVFWPLCRMPH